MKQTKLIILRGPSGSGKTTTAKALFDNAKNRTVLIEQDYYRFIFNPPGGGHKPNSDTIHKMIKSDVLIALECGYDVILEGILSVKAYQKVMEDIFRQHPNNNFIFYFDISFEETLRRHKERQSGAPSVVEKDALIQDMKRHERLQEFGENEMREWYPSSQRSNYEFEKIIPELYSPEEALKMIIRECGL